MSEKEHTDTLKYLRCETFVDLCHNASCKYYIGKTRSGCKCAVRAMQRDAATAIEELLAENAKLKADLDAAKADMHEFVSKRWITCAIFSCHWCKYQLADGRCEWKMKHPLDFDDCFGKHFEWRGRKEQP